MGVNLTMNLIILASLLLSFLPLILGTDNGGEKSLQIDWDKWEKFDSWVEHVHKKRRKKSASLRDFHIRGRKDGKKEKERKDKERKDFGENWDEDLENKGRKKRAPMSNARCCVWIFCHPCHHGHHG